MKSKICNLQQNSTMQILTREIQNHDRSSAIEILSDNCYWLVLFYKITSTQKRSATHNSNTSNTAILNFADCSNLFTNYGCTQSEQNQGLSRNLPTLCRICGSRLFMWHCTTMNVYGLCTLYLAKRCKGIGNIHQFQDYAQSRPPVLE